MARRFVVPLALLGVVCATLDVLSIKYQPEETTPHTDQSWTYEESQNPNYVKKYYNKFFPEGAGVEYLVKNNSGLQTLMEKARHRSAKLEMRLLQWTDYLSSLSVQEKQLQTYVEHFDALEPDTVLNYVQWLLSLDSGAPSGVLDRIHNLVVPMFEHEGLFEMVHSIFTKKLIVHNVLKVSSIYVKEANIAFFKSLVPGCKHD